MFLGIDHPVTSVTSRILGDLVNAVHEKIDSPADRTQVRGEFRSRHHHDFRGGVLDRRETPVVGERKHVKTRRRVLAGHRSRRKVTVTHRRMRVQRAAKPLSRPLKNAGVRRHWVSLFRPTVPTAEPYTPFN